MLLRSITKPLWRAALVSAASTGVAGASATVSQARQIRKAGAWASPGCMQAVKAFRRRMRWAKPLFFKEVQRAIGDGGLIAEAFGGKAGEHIIGPHRPMRLKQYLKRAAAHGGQTQAARGNQSLGAGKGIMGAMCVVVLGKGQIGRSTAGAIIMEHLGPIGAS